MKKLDKIMIGTNNKGKFREICDLLPPRLKKFNPKDFNLSTPKENGKSFKENSLIKAKFFAKSSNLICISDDSGLEIDLLNKKPGIFSARWGGSKNNFNLAIKKVFFCMSKRDIKWKEKINTARFICCLTLYWPKTKKFV